MKLAADVRLAFRSEGREVVVYLAQPHTMADAIVLARLNKAALGVSNTLFDEIKSAFSKWLQVQVAAHTGVVPEMIDVVPPEPREGNA